MSRDITYIMQRGMVDYFMNLLNKPRKEIWIVIKEACNECIDRLDAKSSQDSSWKYATIPDCDIKLRIDVKRSRKYDYGTHTWKSTGNYKAEVKFSNISHDETFTDSQVDEYIVESILLDLNDDI